MQTHAYVVNRISNESKLLMFTNGTSRCLRLNRWAVFFHVYFRHTGTFYFPNAPTPRFTGMTRPKGVNLGVLETSPIFRKRGSVFSATPGCLNFLEGLSWWVRTMSIYFRCSERERRGLIKVIGIPKRGDSKWMKSKDVLNMCYGHFGTKLWNFGTLFQKRCCSLTFT